MLYVLFLTGAKARVELYDSVPAGKAQVNDDRVTLVTSLVCV